jgi:hypothetical protein
LEDVTKHIHLLVLEDPAMFAKIRMTFSILGLIGILTACTAQPATAEIVIPTPSEAPDVPSTEESIPGTPTSLSPVSSECYEIQEITMEECQVLVAIYESTSGESWVDNTGWLASQTPCSWYGVICEQGHVVELQLYYNQLSGSLPPEVGNLTHLKALYLDKNQISGPVPAEIGNLTELQVARLGGNQFSSIPAELTNLNKLVFLELWGNQLSGEIPKDLGNLSSLQELRLNSNQFTGSIPPELGKLTNLTHLNLSHNQLSGSIPPALGDLVVLNELDLSHNQLNGSIPAELDGLKSLYLLDLSYNELTGAIPDGLSSAPISDLRLWANQLDGMVPASEQETTAVDYGGVHFDIHSALFKSIWPEVITAEPTTPGGPGWGVWPEHVRFTIAGPKEDDPDVMRAGTAGQPQIMIYPTREFRAMSEFAAVEIDELQSLLKSRPPAPENELPYLPLVNAAQVFHAQVKYLDFQNGSGVRYITQYSQDMTPIINQSIFYTFQGLTDDGNTYVVATFPISAEGLSDEPDIQDWNAFFAGYQDYIKETVNQLNEDSSDNFTPDLKFIDETIQSLSVNAP